MWKDYQASLRVIPGECQLILATLAVPYCDASLVSLNSQVNKNLKSFFFLQSQTLSISVYLERMRLVPGAVCRHLNGIIDRLVSESDLSIRSILTGLEWMDEWSYRSIGSFWFGCGIDLLSITFVGITIFDIHFVVSCVRISKGYVQLKFNLVYFLLPTLSSEHYSDHELLHWTSENI